MDIIQTFYDNLATQYDKLFSDWHSESKNQAKILDNLIKSCGFDASAKILDCACGIGTQAIGLAMLGYNITASDISAAELCEAKKRAENLNITFKNADFRKLSEAFSQKFNIIIAMDNALPHMLSKEELHSALQSITDRLSEEGMLVASIRDYDELLKTKPPYSPPYIHKTQNGRRVCFQSWDWNNELYNLIQYIIEDEEKLQISKFECQYRATTRQELTELLKLCGYKEIKWLFPEQTKFYQPIVIAKK